MGTYNPQESIRFVRREFIKTAVLGTGAVVLTSYPLISYFITPALKRGTGKWLDFGPVEDLTPGSIEMLTYEFMVKDGWLILPQRGFVWVKTTAEHHINVFSSTCTHLACNVIWQEETNQFVCPCHSGRFDSDGKPVGGPPTQPLSVLEHKIEKDNLMIYLRV